MGKISALSALASAQPDDVVPLVDVHDTSMAATGTTKKIAVANLLKPLVTVAGFLAQPGAKVVAHRGLPQVAPENTMVAFRAAVQVMLSAGFTPAIKLDVYQLADLTGAVAVIHDSTVNRTTTSTGSVTSYTAPTWKTLQANPALVGPAWAAQPLPLLSEVLDELGGKCVLFIEGKNGTAAEVSAILAQITARGLAASCVLTGEDTTLAFPVLAQAAGVGFWYYWLANPVSGPVTPAQAAAAPGVTGLGAAVSQGNAFADSDVTAIVSAAHAAGLPANGFSYIRRYDYARGVSFGVDVHVINDIYVTGTVRAFTADLFSVGAPVPGEPGSTTPATASASAPGYTFAGGPGFYRRQMTPAANLGGLFEALGFMCPVANPANSTWTFTGIMFWDTAETSTSDGATWGGILVCAPDDRFFDSNAKCTGYQCAIRQGNGSTYAVPTLQIYKQNPGAYQNNGSYATGSGVKLGGDTGSATGFAAPNTLGASYPAGTPVTSLTLGSAVTIPAGMKIALPSGQIANVSSPVTASVTVPVTSLTPVSAWSSGQAVSFGVPFSVQVNTTVGGQTTITFKRTDTNDTCARTDSSSPYNGGYVHIGKAGTGSAGSTLTMSYASLTIT